MPDRQDQNLIDAFDRMFRSVKFTAPPDHEAVDRQLIYYQGRWMSPREFAAAYEQEPPMIPIEFTTDTMHNRRFVTVDVERVMAITQTSDSRSTRLTLADGSHIFAAESYEGVTRRINEALKQAMVERGRDEA